jgi:hypothetical protein
MPMPISHSVRCEDLIADTKGLALAAATDVVDRFRWRPDQALLRGKQERLQVR